MSLKIKKHKLSFYKNPDGRYEVSEWHDRHLYGYVQKNEDGTWTSTTEEGDISFGPYRTRYEASIQLIEVRPKWNFHGGNYILRWQEGGGKSHNRWSDDYFDWIVRQSVAGKVIPEKEN